MDGVGGEGGGGGEVRGGNGIWGGGKRWRDEIGNVEQEVGMLEEKPCIGVE